MKITPGLKYAEGVDDGFLLALTVVAAIHHPSVDIDYVRIPPEALTVCLACPAGDGYQEWPCQTWAALQEAKP